MSLCGCRNESTDFDNTKTNVTISAVSSPSLSRTAIDESDYKTVRWSKNDKIYLWAKADGESTYDIENAEFILNYFSPSYDKAIFMADVNSQTTGVNYTYYAAYPKPKSVSGSVVNFSIPAQQNGNYDGTCDLMLATPTTGAALGSDPDDNINLAFKHLTHVIRVEIPQDRDLLKNTSKLVVTFPQYVVGDLSYNIAAARAASWTNKGKTITITSDKPFTENKYIWLFVNPTNIDGTITFTGYTKEGFQSKSITTKLNKKLEAGRITPIKLTVPAELPRTTITLKEVGNNLGEKIQNVTFTAPVGAKFVGEQAFVTLDYNTSNTYNVYYYSSLYGAQFAGKKIAVKYESENAIVHGNDINITAAHHNKVTTFNQTIPYLFEEVFSGISEDGSTETSDLGLPGCPGWTAGDRCQWYKENKVAIRSYRNVGGPFESWVRKDDIPNLKSGKTVKLKVGFNVYWHKNKSGSMKVNVNGSKIALTANKDETKYTTLSNINNSSDIKWETIGENGGMFSGWWFSYDNVDIDEIKVKIEN